jgi:SAM-dependent methyltransferase
MDAFSMSTRVTYRHLPLAREAVEVLIRNRARTSLGETPKSAAVDLLDLCLRISEELLAGRERDRIDQGMEGRLASVLQAAAAEQTTTHSSRLRYALAALHFVERTLGFEISRGARNRARLKNVGVTARSRLVISEERRRRQPCGAYSTPDFIVQAMIEDLFGFLRSEKIGSADVLDMSMEAGHFPIMCSALRPDWLQLQFFGIDRDPAAVMIVKRIAQFVVNDCKESGYRLRTARQNSLFDPLPRYWPGRFKAVIGNPPWRRLDAEGTQLLRERHGPLLRGHDERYLAFILRAHELLRPGGYLCYVIPSGFLFNANAVPIRKLLLEQYDILGLSIYPQRSFVEVPCIIPVSFIARKRSPSSTARPLTRIEHHRNRLGGPDRPRGANTVAATNVWRRLPGYVIHPLARGNCEFLLADFGGQRLEDFGKLYLGPRLVRIDGHAPPSAFRAIQARDIRPFHSCLRNARLCQPNEPRFKIAPKARLILADKVVFQELRYMTQRQRLVAAVAGAGSYPVSTASMFVPETQDATHFFLRAA